MTQVLFYALVMGAQAGNPDPLIERLERLERALQIDDCEYAVDQLEHLTLSYSDIAFRYGLLAEGYLCTGKQEKARMAIEEFARLGGEPNQLGLRVQEFCALEKCAVDPVLVKPVIGENILVPEEVVDVRINPKEVLDEVIKVDEAIEVPTFGNIVVNSRPWANISVNGSSAECIGRDSNQTPCPLQLPTGENNIELKSGPNGSIHTMTVIINEGKNKNTCWDFVSKSPCGHESPTESTNEQVNEEFVEEIRILPESQTHSYTESSIMGQIEMGQCEEAAVDAKAWVEIEPKNYTSQMMLGDALACYPFGTGDIYTAFDAWMVSKDLAKEQGVDFQPMKERLAWALARSGIIKIIPEFEDGVSGLPKDFAIEFVGQRSVDLDPRTDAMMGGIYLTNLPLGDATLTINPGGQREQIVLQLNIAAKLEKVRVLISKETHVAIESIPTPDGYSVSIIDESGEETTYDPSLETLLKKGIYEAKVQYKNQMFPVRVNLENKDSLRQALPWVYMVRSLDGQLLADGLVAPEISEQQVSVVIEQIEFKEYDRVISLTSQGTVEQMDRSLFTEIVIDPSKHPYYASAEELSLAETAVLRSKVRSQWGTGVMALSGFWTVASAVRADELADEPDKAKVWGTQAVIGTIATMSLVGKWMFQEIKGNPSDRNFNELLDGLQMHHNDPIPFEELTP